MYQNHIAKERTLKKKKKHFELYFLLKEIH